MAAKKSTAKKSTDGSKTSTAKKSSGGGQGKTNAAFMKPMQPSAELAAVIGDKPMPRTEVTRKVWEYIKKNKLQDGRNINADDKLQAVFGGKKQVTMFEMTSLVNKHLKAA
jgi:upstream activation factor subunit UAF30